MLEGAQTIVFGRSEVRVNMTPVSGRTRLIVINDTVHWDLHHALQPVPVRAGSAGYDSRIVPCKNARVDIVSSC